MDPVKFLEEKGLLKPGNKHFIVTMDDGTEHDLVHLLQDFHIETSTNKKVPDAPVNLIIWRNRDSLHANDYNPNRVAPPEMDLLETSILEDGWTQPIVTVQDGDILKIVDGFHRYTVSGRKKMMEKYQGWVPTVLLQDKNRQDLQMATIRHNRARGTHAVLEMSNIVAEMIKEGLSQQEIQKRLQMEGEEVIRLSNKAGIPKTDIVQDAEFSKAWVPGEK